MGWGDVFALPNCLPSGGWRMFLRVLGWMGILVAGACCLPSARLAAQTPDAEAATTYRAVLNRYCVTCHNERLKTAGLLLDKADVEHVSVGAEVWEKVIRKLRSVSMPPAGAPRPDKTTYDSFATYLETELDLAALAKPNPGRPAVHRLNRAEYTNAIRDLLAIDTDSVDIPSLLPPDDSGYGFDNIADILTVSPALLERYLSAARKIVRLAVANPAAAPDFQTYDVSKFLLQDDRMSEDLPFGSRGGIALRHYFALDGEYLIKVRLKTNFDGARIPGISKPHQVDIRLDGARVNLFTVGGAQGGRAEGAAAPQSACDLEGQPEVQRYLQKADDGLEVRIPVKAGARLVGVAFSKETSVSEDPVPPSLANREGDNLAVGNVTISGPYQTKGVGDTPSRQKIFVCKPTGGRDEETCTRKILASLARRAYRRPVNDADVQALLGLYRTGHSEGGFEAGIATALQGMLVDSEFLFRAERDPASATPGSASRISDLDLASRLAFFLWSSIPDDALLEAAERGKLHEPAVLEQQVRRMLADPRSKALVENFAGQWLYLRNMRSVMPDLGEFPDFDDNLREAFQKETELFFESMLREDRPVLDLLKADYTFVNERLARHYGMANIYGSHFRRVPVTDGNRQGLLGQGSILTVTSYANRTAPTIRGKWLLANILGMPPPPPPPNVPSLQDRGEDGKLLSMRQQMEQHRANPVCASCHARMDPLGFALENFDAIGQWRNASGSEKTPIDASGVLPDGTKFQGPAGLRSVLLSKPQEFVTTVTEKLMTYALGRGVEYYDAPAIRKILRESAPGGYRWSSLISGIVNSTPFQMRRSPGP
jgi:mono/diheme cytochrome c family protein